jgi:putative nucleotidyltransferase with HDIG domain
LPIFNRREHEIIEQALRAREKEVRALEERVKQQDEALQNLNRLLEQSDRAISALTNLAHLYGTESSTREMAHPFLELTIKAARCEGGVIALRDPGQPHLTIAAALGDRQDTLRQMVFNENEGILGEVARSGEPLLVPDARKDPRFREDGPDAIMRESRNALCVPVEGPTRIWGALLLMNTIGRKRFIRHDVELQSVFAMGFARELEQEMLHAKAREEATRLTGMLRVTELLHVTGDVHRIQELVVQMAARLAKAQGAALFMLDDTQQTLTCAAATERLLRVIQVPMGVGLAGTVAMDGHPVSAAAADPRFSGMTEQAFSFQVKTVAAVPVKAGQRLLGVLEVANAQGSLGFEPPEMASLSLLAREAGIAIDHVQKATHDQRTIMDLLRGLARSMDAKSPAFAGHSERVAKLAQTVAEEMGMAGEEISRVYLGALLHDLGNAGVDDDLLLAPRKLTEEETRQVRQHTRVGAEILRDVAALRSLAPGVLYHHERWDGTGYPEGLKGESIPAMARIIAVAEAFDASRSARPYREALPVAEALNQVRQGGGTIFDPSVVSALLAAYQRGKIPG